MKESRSSPLLPPIGRPAWLVLGMNMLSCAGSGLTMPFLIVYLHNGRGISLQVSGLVLASIGVAGLATTPLTGPLIDRFGALPTFILGLVIAGVGIGGFTLAHSPATALLPALLNGAGGGLSWNGIVTLLAELAPPAERGSVFGLRYTTANVGFAAGALVAGFAIRLHSPGSYTTLFVGDFASYLLFSVALLLVARTAALALPRRPPARDGEHDQAKPGGYRAVLTDKALIGITAVNAVLMIVALGQETTAFPAWATGGAHSTTRVVGMAFAVNIAVLLTLQLVAIRVMRGRPRTSGAAVASVFFAVGWLVALLPATSEVGWFRNLALIAALGVFSIGEVLLAPTLSALVNDLAPDRLRGRYNAVFTLSNQIGPIVAPIIAGLALGTGHGVLFLLGLALGCLAAGGAALLLGRVISHATNTGLPPAERDNKCQISSMQ